MSNIIDNICKLRDFLQQKDIYELSRKLKYKRALVQSVFDEIHRQIDKRNNDYSHELDFTALDLRWLADDIKNVFKKWETLMDPEHTLKIVKNNMTKERTVDIQWFCDRYMPIMEARRDNMQILTELLNLLEFHATYLYLLELASNDEFAIKYAHDIKI